MGRTPGPAVLGRLSPAASSPFVPRLRWAAGGPAPTPPCGRDLLALRLWDPEDEHAQGGVKRALGFEDRGDQWQEVGVISRRSKRATIPVITAGRCCSPWAGTFLHTHTQAFFGEGQALKHRGAVF